jgi:hypothetical protein
MVHPEDQQVECLLRQIDPHARRETPLFGSTGSRLHVLMSKRKGKIAGLTGAALRKFRNSVVGELLG